MNGTRAPGPDPKPPVGKMNRAARRAQKVDPLEGVMFVRYDVTPEALAKVGVVLEGEPEVSTRSLVMAYLDEALLQLESEGADVWSMTIVTLGTHPRNPGGISIEVKSREVKA